MAMKEKVAPSKWYRVPIMWLVVGIPVTTVVVSFVMAWIAVRSWDGLVADDYYKEGKEINRVLKRDIAARTQGLDARIELSAGHATAHISAAHAGGIPDQVQLALRYATRDGLDRVVMLKRDPGGAWVADVGELVVGKWHAELAANDWRLVGVFHVPEEAGFALVPAKL